MDLPGVECHYLALSHCNSKVGRAVRVQSSLCYLRALGPLAVGAQFPTVNASFSLRPEGIPMRYSLEHWELTGTNAHTGTWLGCVTGFITCV